MTRFWKVSLVVLAFGWLASGVDADDRAYDWRCQEINPPSPPDAIKTTAIVGATLIDGRGGTPVKNAVVVVRGTTIVNVGVAGQIAIPKDAERVDASGMSLLPGLIDSHFHSMNTTRTPVEYELWHGITTFRDPGHPFRFYDAVRKSDAQMPRVFLCGGHLDGPPPVWPDQAVLIQDTDHARRAVNEHVDHGASAIKVYFRLPLDQVKAVCETAEKRGVPVTAHLELVDADDAIAVGVRGIEHVTSFGTALADPKVAEQFRTAIFAESGARKQWRHRLWASLDLESSANVGPLLDTIVKHRVFVSPTLAVFERRAGQKGASEADQQGFANMLRFVGLCHKAGASIVVGSHTGAPFADRGRAYQRELELLIEAGLSPMEAIQAGTLVNAQFLGCADRLGSITPGKLADLVLVEGDPNQDIDAMRNVRKVMLNGNWVEIDNE